MTFKDEAKISVKAGAGGDGRVSFRREKYVPRGGPDGGDGGAGGNIIFKVDPATDSLLEFVRRKNWPADRGEPGKGSRQTGKSGSDLILPVPIGTQIFDQFSRKLLADLNARDDQYLAARGGRGGKGNCHFATAVRQAPRFAQAGFPGEERDLELILKLIADVGIIGLPNSGKSTLLARITAAKPKIAAYPFTTLEPNIGVTTWRNKRFVCADIPGLISGASSGRGLGIKFLRHIERTRILLHLVSTESADPKQDYKTIRGELSQYSPVLLKKPEIIVFSKSDLGKPVKSDLTKFAISAVTGQGINLLLDQIVNLVNETDS